MAEIDLPPEADAFVNRVRKVEGTLGGSGYVKYGGEEFKPDKNFPQWEGVEIGGGKKTHAAGPGQWQPGTWEEQKKTFQGYGVDLDFSNEQHQKAAIWDKGYKEYKAATGGRDLREDLKANKVQWDRLSSTWQGFAPRVTQTDRPGGKIDQGAIGYEQSRPHQSVWYVDPLKMLDLLPPQTPEEEAPKRKSLLESLAGRGEDIYDLPHVDLSTEGDTRKITDYDGRNRLRAMAEAGLTAVPVVLKGVEPGTRPIALEGLTGKKMPLTFDPVPSVPRRSAKPYDALMDRARDITTATTDQTRVVAAGQKEKVYYDDGGQPFTLSGGRLPPSPDAGYTGSILPLRRDESGLHFAVPEAITSVVRGAIEGGQRALGIGEAGQNPLRPLSWETMGAAAALGGAPLPPASRFTPGLATLAPEGRNMLASAEAARGVPLIERGPPPLKRITPESAALAKEASEKFNIPVYGNESAAHQVAKERAYNRAASRTIGEDAPALVPAVMKAAKDRLQDGLERIETSHYVRFNPDFYGRTREVWANAQKNLTKQERAVVERNLRDILVDEAKTAARKEAAKKAKATPGAPKVEPKDVMRSGLSGTQFGNLMRHKGALDRAEDNANSNIANAAKEIKEAMRDVLKDNLPPETAAEYQNLRYQYKNLKTLEPVVEKSATGDVDPVKLDTQVDKNFPNRAYDKSPALVKLADIGKEFIKPQPAPPNRPVVNALGALAGYAAGHFVGGPVAGFAGAAAAHEATRHAVAAMMRPKLTEALVERALAQSPNFGARRNAIADLMSRTGANTLTMPGGGGLLAQPLRLPTGSLLGQSQNQ